MQWLTATLKRCLTPILLIALAGCAPFQREVPSEPAVQPAVPSAGAVVLKAAESRLGAPYRYGGSGPDAFDCSGLVVYAHYQAGLVVPRTAAQQFAAATPVPRTELRAGDLVFFRLSGSGVSHVGIYAGGDRFVHAPQSGGHVRFASLEDDVFRRGYVGGGRFAAPPP